MYLPKKFTNDNVLASFDLIRQYPFATVITAHNQGPWISHIPLVIEVEDDRAVLFGHVARANPHANLLGQSQATAVFMGPNAYITPTWYEENDVPTWNYMTVHVRGRCKMMTDKPGIIECIKKLTDVMEANRERRWDFWIPDDLQGAALEKHIVGFKLEIENIEAKFKMSQNRSQADFDGVLKGLSLQNDDLSRAVARQMKSLRS